MKFNIILGLVASVIAMNSSKKSNRSNWFNNPNSSYYVDDNDSLKQKLDHELKLIEKHNSYANSKENIKTGSESYFIAWLNYEFQLPWNEIQDERKPYYEAIGLNEGNWDNPESSETFISIVELEWTEPELDEYRTALENIGYNQKIWSNYDLFPIANEDAEDQVIVSVNYYFANADQLKNFYRKPTINRNRAKLIVKVGKINNFNNKLKDLFNINKNSKKETKKKTKKETNFTNIVKIKKRNKRRYFK